MQPSAEFLNGRPPDCVLQRRRPPILQGMQPSAEFLNGRPSDSVLKGRRPSAESLTGRPPDTVLLLHLMKIVRILATSTVLNPYSKWLTNLEKSKEHTCKRQSYINNLILPQASLTQVDMMTHWHKIAKYNIQGRRPAAESLTRRPPDTSSALTPSFKVWSLRQSS